MIKSILKKTGLLVHAQYLREKYFPSKSQLREKDALPERMSFYQQFLSKGDLCFDVGANIGNRTKVFLALGATVVAVEPQKECAKMLKLRFGNKIKLVNKALGQKDDEGIIYIGESSAISSLSKDWIESISSSRFKGKKWNAQERVKITSMDKLIAQYGQPKFCKIDVEGYEEEVLKGLSKKISYLSFEYAVPEKLKGIANCFAELERIGKFYCNYTIGEKMEFKLQKWVEPKELLEYIDKIASQRPFGDIYVKFID
jgi:FkbM family methyltransferase